MIIDDDGIYLILLAMLLYLVYHLFNIFYKQINVSCSMKMYKKYSYQHLRFIS